MVNGALFAQVLNSYGGYSTPNQTQITTIVPFISSSNQKLASSVPSITINGQGFISFINNNTQIQVQLYQQQQSK